MVLVLVLAGFILYESGIVNTGAGHSTKKIIAKKIPESEKIVSKKENSELTAPKNKQSAKKIISRAGNKKKEARPDLSKPGNGDNKDARTYVANLAKEKRNFNPAIEKINKLPFISMQNKIAAGFKMPAAIDALLKTSLTKNTNQKRIQRFKPFWTLTGLATYDQANYRLDSDQPNAITSIKHREEHEPSFSVGVLATRQLKEKWGLQTGLVYSYTAIGIGPQKLFAFQDPAGDLAYKYITSSGYAYFKPGFGAPPVFGDSITTTEAKQSLHAVSVPVIIKYTIEKNKFLFIPGAGIEANFITRAKLETEIEDAANRETVFITKLNGTKSFYWSLVADVDLRYIINKKFAFNLRPMFRYAISAITTEDNEVETFPYSFGLGLGITCKF